MTEREVKRIAEAVLRALVVALMCPLFVFLGVAIVSAVIGFFFFEDYLFLARVFFLATFVDFIFALGLAMSAGNLTRAIGGQDEGPSR